MIEDEDPMHLPGCRCWTCHPPTEQAQAQQINDPIWETADGREIPLSDMYSEHIRSAQAKLQDWRNDDEDPDRRRNLKLWHKRFGAELDRRKGDWFERTRGADRRRWAKRRSEPQDIAERIRDADTSDLLNLRRQLKGDADHLARVQLRQVNKELRRRRAGKL
jgi:hypothetical protein